MPTYPLPTIAAQVDAAGISAPTFADILASLQASFLSIYGSDAYIAPDSQDGQFLALLASAINDSNDMAIAVFNAFSPSYAQGAGLSSVVKINGLARLVATNSTAIGTVVGVVGTTIIAGSVRDINGNLWDLPSPITIPGAGSLTLTVTAREPGNINAPAGTINVIATPTLGWQSFTSIQDAEPGAPVETDAALRRRQAVSTALPSETVLDGVLGAVLNLTGVKRAKIYENATGSTDSNGLPAHSISLIVEGGTLSQIATAIGQRKTPGAATYGSTSQTYTDPVTGVPSTIKFYVLAYVQIAVVVNITALANWESTTTDQIKADIAAYINSLDIGVNLQFSRLWMPAYLNGDPDGLTYEITSMTIQVVSGPPAGTSDIAVAFNKAAACSTSNITVNVS